MVSDADVEAGILPRDKISGLIEQAKQAGHDGLLVKDMAELDTKVMLIFLLIISKFLQLMTRCGYLPEGQQQ